MSVTGSEGASAYRLFVAIDLPEPVRSALARAQTDLRRALSGAGARWIPRESMHLTLKFLGDVPVAQAVPLIGALQGALRDCRPLPLRVVGLGVFPDARSPRIIWAGVDEASGALARVQRRVEEACGLFVPGQPMERFSAHVTIGRLRQVRRAQAEMLAIQMSRMQALDFGEWIVEDVKLFRSELQPSGARHSILADIPLGPVSGNPPPRLPGR